MAIAAGYFFAYYFLAGLAINLGYHRTLSHRSVKLRKWFERFIITLGLPAGTPIQWVGNHRFHHLHAETPADPHSPHISGFWYAHVGWYIPTKRKWICILYSLAGPLRTLFDAWNRPRTNQQFNHLAHDVAQDRYYAWVSKATPYLLACWLHMSFFVGIAVTLLGAEKGVAVAWLSSFVIYNLGDSIDSWAHIIGDRPFRDSHKAGNHWLLGLLILGEGWHANHHSFPESARHGLFPGQWDCTWKIIQALEFSGIASTAKMPNSMAISEKLLSDRKPGQRQDQAKHEV